MLKSYLTAVLGIAALMVGWAIVQQLWGRLFNPGSPGADVLEWRTSCGKCGCASPCAQPNAEIDEKGRISFESKDNG